ncbi:MAG: hypothetical protein RKL32_00200, partial [Gammaproteobacteria bacterium]
APDGAAGLAKSCSLRPLRSHAGSMSPSFRRARRPISQFDAQIAAIAQSAGADVATSNVAGFDGCGIKVIDPWQA